MLQIIIYLNKEKQITGFQAKGHCNYAEKGKDIICASTSSIIQTAILGLEKYCEIQQVTKPEVNQSDGFLSVKNINNTIASSIIASTMLLGLCEVEKQYPEYIKIYIIAKE